MFVYRPLQPPDLLPALLKHSLNMSEAFKGLDQGLGALTALAKSLVRSQELGNQRCSRERSVVIGSSLEGYSQILLLKVDHEHRVEVPA